MPNHWIVAIVASLILIAAFLISVGPGYVREKKFPRGQWVRIKEVNKHGMRAYDGAYGTISSSFGTEKGVTNLLIEIYFSPNPNFPYLVKVVPEPYILEAFELEELEFIDEDEARAAEVMWA